jgi:hypothetical protein
VEVAATEKAQLWTDSPASPLDVPRGDARVNLLSLATIRSVTGCSSLVQIGGPQPAVLAAVDRCCMTV